MTDQYEALTPVEVEQKMRFLDGELQRAVKALREKRQAELAAKAAYESAKRRATLSPDCPKVARDGFTVAYRDAWVGEQVAAEEQKYEVAKVARQAASDYLTTVREQVSLVQSINKSVDTAYRMPGGHR